MNAEKTVVIFRKFPDTGGIIAVFPELPASPDTRRECLSYMHVGQHGACDLFYFFQEGATVPCDNPEHYGALKSELEQLGYNLRVYRSDQLNGWEPRHWDKKRKENYDAAY